jgi:hypothetical protein
MSESQNLGQLYAHMAESAPPLTAARMVSGEVVQSGMGDPAVYDKTRAGERERKGIQDVLGMAMRRGQLTGDEFTARYHLAAEAVTLAELGRLTSDLPAGIPRKRSRIGAVAGFVAALCLDVFVMIGLPVGFYNGLGHDTDGRHGGQYILSGPSWALVIGLVLLGVGGIVLTGCLFDLWQREQRKAGR